MDLETWEYMKREQIAVLTMAAMMVERSKDLEQAGRHVRGLLQICEAQIPPMGLKKSADNLSPAEIRRRTNSSWEPGY